MSNLKFVTNTAGDWEAIYIDNILCYEEHSIHSFQWLHCFNSGVTGAAGGVSSGTAATSTVVTRGIMNYNPSILQRDRSRVPYNANVVADTSNPAWTWADGVLDKIIETSHSRGYFSGDNFILEPVNIINGNGYYNLYLPDGT